MGGSPVVSAGRVEHGVGDDGRQAGDAPSLEVSTQLGDWEGRWILGLYEDAAEASGSFRYTGPLPTNRGRRGEAADPERSKQVSMRRSAGRIRRYVTANRLNRLGTLTYAQACFDPVRAREDIGEFFRGSGALWASRSRISGCLSGIREATACIFTLL